MKNVTEISKELNVSKTTIRNYLRNLPEDLAVTKKGRSYQINKDIEHFLKENIKVDFDEISEKNVKFLNRKIGLLNKKIEEVTKDNEYLKQMLNNKEDSIEEFKILLKQQQRLQLDATKELKNIKNKLY